MNNRKRTTYAPSLPHTAYAIGRSSPHRLRRLAFLRPSGGEWQKRSRSLALAQADQLITLRVIQAILKDFQRKAQRTTSCGRRPGGRPGVLPGCARPDRSDRERSRVIARTEAVSESASPAHANTARLIRQ